MLPIVDTHQHLWDLSRFELAWLEGLPVLNKSHVMSDYLEVTKNANVTKTVYMEVDVVPNHRIMEADYVFELCVQDDNPMQGAVISANPGDPNFRPHLKPYLRNPYFKGVRQVLHGPEMPKGACLDETFIQNVQWLGQQGRSFDICIRPAELDDGVQLARQCPDTQFILDHCGNASPTIVNGADPGPQTPDNLDWHTAEQWKADIAAYADLPNVVCKISGIVARAPEGWTAETLAPTINYCLDTFGPDRVIFGGDWPVCTLVATFEEWSSALREVIKDRSEEDQRKLLHDNSVGLYGLE